MCHVIPLWNATKLLYSPQLRRARHNWSSSEQRLKVHQLFARCPIVHRVTRLHNCGHSQIQAGRRYVLRRGRIWTGAGETAGNWIWKELSSTNGIGPGWVRPEPRSRRFACFLGTARRIADWNYYRKQFRTALEWCLRTRKEFRRIALRRIDASLKGI